MPENLITLILAALFAGLLFAIAAWWRLREARGRTLPVWDFLRRRGAPVEGDAALAAEIRCELCASQPRCRQIVAAGGGVAVPGCPNERLFRRAP